VAVPFSVLQKSTLVPVPTSGRFFIFLSCGEFSGQFLCAVLQSFGVGSDGGRLGLVPIPALSVPPCCVLPELVDLCPVQSRHGHLSRVYGQLLSLVVFWSPGDGGKVPGNGAWRMSTNGILFSLLILSPHANMVEDTDVFDRASAHTAPSPLSTKFVGLSGGEIFHEMMLQHGVKHIFGYPGGTILPVFDAIHESDHFKFILPRHEQGAGHMAEGYARAT
jgi:hypothetical protein